MVNRKKQLSDGLQIGRCKRRLMVPYTGQMHPTNYQISFMGAAR